MSWHTFEGEIDDKSWLCKKGDKINEAYQIYDVRSKNANNIRSDAADRQARLSQTRWIRFHWL